MRKLVLLAALLVAWVGVAQAQQAVMGSKSWKKNGSLYVVGGVTPGDTLVFPFSVNSSGQLSTSEVTPDQTFNQQALAVINSSGTTLAQRDSSQAPTNTIGWRRMAIGLAYTLKDSVSIDHVLMGITVQGSYSSVSDSTTLFTWRRWRAPLASIGAAAVVSASDTLSNQTLGARDTSGTVIGSLTAGLPQTAGPNEIVVELPISRQAWSVTGSRFLWIMLDGPDGPFQAPYTVIRCRPLAAINSSGANITYTCPIKYRIDLIGMR